MIVLLKSRVTPSHSPRMAKPFPLFVVVLGLVSVCLESWLHFEILYLQQILDLGLDTTVVTDED